MGVFEFTESQFCFFLRGILHEAETAMVLRVDFLWQAYLFDVTEWLEKFSDFLRGALKSQIFDQELLRLNIFIF